MKLKDRVAVITGGGSGIGRATAVLLANEGARIAIVDRDEAGATETARQVQAAGSKAMVRIGDVGHLGQADADAKAIVEAWGRIDVLMTAAGFSCGGTVTTTEPADWNAVVNVNLGGTWLWSRAVLPTMQQAKRGSIITVASQLAIAGGRNSSAYIAAKGAILSLTRTMALDYAADGVRVNAIAPGAVETPLLARGFGRRPDPEAAKEGSRQRHAMQRFGQPDEVAQAALYLASDASSFSTGTTLVVDGGWLAN
jgi:2-keto-3-deoxy-L-fuconate dehydrogenase